MHSLSKSINYKNKSKHNKINTNKQIDILELLKNKSTGLIHK